MSKPSIVEQVDQSGSVVYYSWLLDGYGRNTPTGAKLAGDGWNWVKGGPGCFVTQDAELAADTAAAFGLRIVSNGTHATHGLPMAAERVAGGWGHYALPGEPLTVENAGLRLLTVDR